MTAGYFLPLQSGHGHWSQPQPVHASRIMQRFYRGPRLRSRSRPPAPPARISQTLRVKGDRFEDPVLSPEHSLVLRRVLNASRTSRSMRNAGFLPRARPEYDRRPRRGKNPVDREHRSLDAQSYALSPPLTVRGPRAVPYVFVDSKIVTARPHHSSLALPSHVHGPRMMVIAHRG